MLLFMAVAFFHATALAQCTDTLKIVSKKVSCTGRCDGTATATVTGSTAPFAYYWSTSPLQVTRIATGLCAGTYTLTVVDARGCSVVQSTTVDSVPLKATIAPTNVTCSASADGKLDADPTGGTLPYKYTWSTTPVKSTKTAFGLTAGSYTVTVTDKNGCSTTASDSLRKPAAIVVTATTNASVCNASNGSATVTIAGGVLPYTYSWNASPPQTTANLNNVSPGNYTLTIVDSFGCTKTSAVAISSSSGLALKTTKTNVLCAGTATGKSTATASGGTKPYTYSWSTGATTAKISNVAAATYTVTVTDKNGCTASEAVAITSNAAMAAKITATPVSCFGGSDGQLKAVISGGKSPYTYSWSTSIVQHTDTIGSLSANTYTLLVTDTNACTASFTAVVAQPNALKLTFIDSVQRCYAQDNASVTVLTSGGTKPYRYFWQNTDAPLDTNRIVHLSFGTFTVNVQDSNGCSVTEVDTLKATPMLTLNTAVTTAGCTLSNGAANVAATGGTGPYAYLWSTGATSTGVSGLNAGVYNVTVTDHNACTATTAASILNASGFSVGVLVNQNITCFGDSLGSIAVNASGGALPYQYHWNNTPTNAALLNHLKGGVYQVTVTDANGCIQVANVDLMNPPLLQSTFYKVNALCPGHANGSDSIAVSGGIAPYVYNWSNGSSVIGASTLAIHNILAGTYSVTVTDANGCSLTLVDTIAQPQFSFTTTNIAPFCVGDSNAVGMVRMAGGTGPYTFTWSTTPAQNTNTVRGVFPGTYTVTVTDKYGCTTLAYDTIHPPLALEPVAVGTIPCGLTLGSVAVSTAGGTLPYHYLWSTADTLTTIANLISGNYSVTVTDHWGCTSQSVALVPAPSIIENNLNATEVTCFAKHNGVLVATPSGGIVPYSFSWSNGAVVDSLAGLVAGKYLLTITDARGCTLIDSAVLTQPLPLSWSSQVTPTACGQRIGAAAVHAAGGTAPYTYLWQTNPVLQDSVITGLLEQTYWVSIADQNGCDTLAAVVVGAQGKLGPAAATIVNEKCNGDMLGSIAVVVQGASVPLHYLWSSGDTLVSLVNVSAGTYSLAISDGVLCTLDTSFAVTQPLPLLAAATAVFPDRCGRNDGKDSIAVQGGVAPYTYAWPDGSTNQVDTSLSAGAYAVTVTDVNACATSVALSVASWAAPAVLVKQVVSTCPGLSQGAIALQRPPTALDFVWDNADTGAAINHLAAGAYTVTVADMYNCTTSAAIDVDAYVVSSPNLGDALTIEKGMSAQLSAQGEWVSYLWQPAAGLSDPTIADPVASPLVNTEYVLRVVDQHQCVVQDSIMIHVKELFLPSAFSPNGDGINDIYYVQGVVDYVQLNFLIFDRWGELVFSADNPQLGWDGTAGGVPLDPGVFIYTLNVKFADGHVVHESGSITLVR